MIRLRNLSKLFFLGSLPIICAIAHVLILVALASAQTAEINAVGFEWGEDRYEIVIKGKGSPNCSSKYVENPPRIELQCENTINRIQRGVEAPENPFVYRVSGSPSGNAEKRAKLTVDLKWKFAYAIEGIADGLIVRLFSRTVQPLVTTIQPSAGIAQPPASAVQTPKTVSESTKTVPAIPAAASPSVDLTKEDLVIGPDDLLEINVFQLPEFSLTTRVLGDGTITMPLIGAVEVSGLNRKQAEQKISQALTAKQVNNPSVSVDIKEYKSRQVSVLGSVRNAGIYYLTSSRTLLQLLSEAGGLTGDAGRKCFIFRGGSKIEVDLYDLMQNGNQDLNLAISPGDVINVQPRTFAYILGAVRSPGAVEITPSSLTLAQAIARAGGPTRLANLSNIQIKRKDASGKEQVIKANLKDILRGKVPDVPLIPEDLVNVPESFF